jgi:hypothetical protein
MGEILEHTSSNYTLSSSIWKLFLVLLESICGVDYQMAITAVDIEARDALGRIEASFEDKIVNLEGEKGVLQKKIDDLIGDLKSLEHARLKEIARREELEEELLTRGSGHETEVEMRLKFESQLNHLYAVKQELEHKLETSKEKVRDVKD